MRFALFLFAFTAAAQNWPSFRGPSASGVADGQNVPVQWDVERGVNVLWETPIRGLAHSSPAVWGDRVYLTTAVSSKAGATFKPGLYGEGDASDDVSVHVWNVLCLDRATGKVLWERTAYKGVPREKRHIKSTYANATPATDGRIVVAFFGSQGLFDRGSNVFMEVRPPLLAVPALRKTTPWRTLGAPTNWIRRSRPIARAVCSRSAG